MFKAISKIICTINVVVLCISNLCTSVPNKIDSQKLAQSMQVASEARIEAGTLSGAHCIVMQNGEVMLDETYGYDGVGGETLSKDAVYRIASMTKPVTAVAMLIEQDRGHLNIYDDLSKYLPEFSEMYLAKRDAAGNVIYDENGLIVKGEKATTSIKLYQLLSHYSGMGEIDLAYTGNENTTVKTASDFMATQALLYEPGTEYLYSTSAFDVAARVIEKTSGMEFAEYLKVNIFDKLGMKDATFEPNEDQWSRMVRIHNMKDGIAYNQEQKSGSVYDNFPCTYHAAGAGLASTAADFEKFAQMLLNEGVGDNGARILSKKAVELMHTPIDDDQRGYYYRWGLSVRIIVKEGRTLPVGSYYWSGAYGSHFWIDPENRITAVYMKNSEYDGGAGNKSANEFEANVIASIEIAK